MQEINLKEILWTFQSKPLLSHTTQEIQHKSIYLLLNFFFLFFWLVLTPLKKKITFTPWKSIKSNYVLIFKKFIFNVINVIFSLG